MCTLKVYISPYAQRLIKFMYTCIMYDERISESYKGVLIAKNLIKIKTSYSSTCLFHMEGFISNSTYVSEKKNGCFSYILLQYMHILL